MIRELRIAVRTLVEHVYRGGDLVQEFSGTARSLDGIRGHQKVQRTRPENYTPEVSVSSVFETDRFVLNISGRIDGVFKTEQGIIIDEIKTTTRLPEVLEERQHPTHWAQAKAYAYIYAQQHDLEDITVQLTYYHLETGHIQEFTQFYRFDELDEFFKSLIDRYIDWAKTLTDWYRIRDESIGDIQFPFSSYRQGQREMAVAVYRTIQNGDQLMVNAATGIGKTMAVLFPAVKALPEAPDMKIFYLTARTTGRKAAEQALEELRSNGLKFKSVTLTAKEKICSNIETTCTPERCEYAKGHFDRIDAAVNSAFTMDALTRESIKKIAEEHKVCPFELSLELSLWADGVICDYNYAFDPRVYLRRFFLESTSAHTFLIDEAHNLVDRSRDMFSAELRKQPVLEVRRLIKNALPDLYRHLTKINSYLLKKRKACEESGDRLVTKNPPENLYPLLRQFITAADRWLALNIPTAFRKELLDFFFAAVAFNRVGEQFDASYSVCCEKEISDFRIRLFCMDPSEQMKAALQRCRSAIFFSATLTPSAYFRRILGCSETIRKLTIPSPFPPENFGVFIHTGITTLYHHRERTAPDLVKILDLLTRNQRGNYMFFFPSYAYLQMVKTLFREHSPEADIIAQKPEMGEEERDAFIAMFREDNTETLIGFVVMGGIFGEGIDLVGNRLTAAAIVGVGLPGISPERELIREYFTAVNGQGFEFAYVYPGVNRVLQAAGRVIRTAEDRGTVVLIDQRFGTGQYKYLLPENWRTNRVNQPTELANRLSSFWNPSQ